MSATRNIQVIDEMPNTAYDIFSCSIDDFQAIFQPGTDIEFVEDVFTRLGDENARLVFERLWEKPVSKSAVQGIHGTLFFGLADQKRRFYPNKREADLNGCGRRWPHG